uniref:Uncharacterized protein n=1 Tax=Acrobeloides nanus TaxID=290746 RepID=A0A914BYT6_9BILA
MLFYLIAAILNDSAMGDESEASDLADGPKIYVLRQSNIISPLSDDLLVRRALPYSNLVFEKRAIPFSGGIYGKRSTGLSSINYKRARELPFSGGIYGKRASVPFSGGIYGKRSGGSVQLKRDFFVKTKTMPMMPLSGGIYG